MPFATKDDVTNRPHQKRTCLFATMFAVLLLSACVEEGGIAPSTAHVTRGQVDDRTFYLQHHYVNDARAFGDRAFAAIKAGDGRGASDYFARSTNTLASGLQQHRAFAAERADTQRVIAGIGMLAVGVAAINASSDAQAQARTAADVAAVNQNFANFMQQFNNVSSFIGEQIRLGEINTTAEQARFVNRDLWRAIVVSNDNIARSVVRVRNQTTGGMCTGFFVSPYLIATSAHCFRLGDALGAYRQNPQNGRAFMTQQDEFISISHLYENNLYDRNKICDPYDIALLLTDRPSENYLPLSDSPVRPGQRLLAMGYSGDLNKGYYLRADYGCAVTGIGPNGQVQHNCSSFRGNSGGPIITATGQIAAIGVHSCGPTSSGNRGPGRAAASVQRLAPMLNSMRNQPETQGRLINAPF